jgi:hypothetical protein
MGNSGSKSEFGEVKETIPEKLERKREERAEKREEKREEKLEKEIEESSSSSDEDEKDSRLVHTTTKEFDKAVTLLAVKKNIDLELPKNHEWKEKAYNYYYVVDLLQKMDIGWGNVKGDPDPKYEGFVMRIFEERKEGARRLAAELGIKSRKR